MNPVYCLTPTGNRPEGMALLGEYLNAQTYAGPLTWIVVDDCEPATRVPRPRDRSIQLQVIRPAWRWQPGMNTQSACLTAGLTEVPDHAALVIVEDDDAYLPQHLDNMARALHDAELAGESHARYYNVATRHWQEMNNQRHSSLCATACRGAALKLLRQLCSAQPRKFIDIDLWRQFSGRKVLTATHNVVGIKGLPGRPGIGAGHRDRFGKPDRTGVLRAWLGDYADNYRPFRRAA